MDEIVHGVTRFDRFELDLTRGCLRLGDQDIELRPKTFEVLCHLVANAGRLVPKEEFFAAIWPNVTVGDDSLVQCIRELRQKIGDDGHRLIKTVSRRGYMLEAEATALAGKATPATPVRSQSPSVRPVRNHLAPSLRVAAHRTVAKLVTLCRLMTANQWRLVAAAFALVACTAAAGTYMLAPSATRTADGAKAIAKEAAVAARSLRATFRDCNVCPEMVELPAGEFVMGSPQGEPGRRQMEAQRRVSITKRFGLGRFEVTVDQFETFIAETGLKVENVCQRLLANSERWVAIEGTFRQPGFDVTGSHPAVCVSWYDAQAYLVWLGRRTGKPYRLPSEAEWEYAARAGTTSCYSFGDDEARLCDYARFADLGSPFPWGGACRSGTAVPGPIQTGRLKPNPWGFFDMHGNAWEWVADCWTPDVRKTAADGMAFTRPEGCEIGVLRGGGWPTNFQWLRSANRTWLPLGARRYHSGFRVAVSLGG